MFKNVFNYYLSIKPFPSRGSWTLLAAALCVAPLRGQASPPLRIQYPILASGTGDGWEVDPAIGALTLRIACETVPGDLPVPVVFRFNATHTSQTVTAGIWSRRFDPESGKTHGTHEDGPVRLSRPIFATLHFGFVTGRGIQLIPRSTASEKPYVHHPKRRFFVLEDGSIYTSEDFSNGITDSTTTLTTAFGLQGRPSNTLAVTGNGRLATYETAPAGLGRWEERAARLAPGAAMFQVLLDRDKARIFAPLGPNGTSLPILWVDRFGHSVAFEHTRRTVPATSTQGTASVRSTRVTNDQGKGVLVQWIEAPASQELPTQAGLRVDYLGLVAPSLQVTGHPGSSVRDPQGMGGDFAEAMAPVAGGAVLRPVEVRLGDPSTLPVPEWASPVPMDTPGTWPEDQVCTFTYDDFRAELTSFTDFRGVVTSLAWETRLFHNPRFDSAETYRSVLSAESFDPRTQATLTRSYTRKLPEAAGDTEWATTAMQAWSGPDVDQAEVPVTRYQFAPPSSPQFGNGVPISETLLGADGRTLSEIRTTYGKGGIDGTLPLASHRTQRLAGSPDIETDFDLDAAYGVPLTVRKTSGGHAEEQTFAYESHPDLLEPRRLLHVHTSRTSQGVAHVAPAVQLSYDPTTWFLSERAIAGGADGETVEQFHYDPATGRLRETRNFGRGGILPGGSLMKTEVRDPGSGLQTKQTITFDIPGGGTDSYAVAWPARDSLGRTLARTDAHGVNTTHTYDPRGRLLSRSTPGQAPLSRTYPDAWTTTSIQGGRETVEVLDGFGRLISLKRGEDGIQVTYRYDANGRLASTRERAPNGATRTLRQRFDPLGRLVAEIPARGPASTFAYAPANGNRMLTRTIAGTPVEVATEAQDLWGQVVDATDIKGTRTTISHDAQGQPLEISTTPPGQATQVRSFTYNGLGWLTSRTTPETGRTEFSGFDAQGLPSRVKEANGRTRRLAWDGLRRLRRNEGGDASVSFTYDGPRLASATSTQAQVRNTVTYGYDSLGRLASEAATLGSGGLPGWRIAYGYDAAGRLETLTYPSGRIIRYAFDDASGFGRVKEDRDGGRILAQVDRDPWGHRRTLNFGSGAANWWEFSPDGLQMRAQVLDRKSGGSIRRSYAFDANHHLARAGEWTALDHDTLGRLKGATLSDTAGIPLPAGGGPIAFDDDGYGNQVLSTGGAPSLNHGFSLAVSPADNRIPPLTTDGAVTGLSYNAAGEALTLSRAVGATVPQIGLAWDGIGRLIAAGPETFTYLPSGMRSNRINTFDGSQNRIYATSAAGQVLTEYRQVGTGSELPAARDIVYLEGQAIVEVDPEGVHELHADHLGSPIMITRGDTGEAEGWQFFGLFGEAFHTEGYRPATGFTGHVQEDATGLIYMRGRFYSPVWHRFVNSDQGADPGQANQFAYCGGSPIMRVDPSGMADVNGTQFKEYPPEREFNQRRSAWEIVNEGGTMGGSFFQNESFDTWFSPQGFSSTNFQPAAVPPSQSDQDYYWVSFRMNPDRVTHASLYLGHNTSATGYGLYPRDGVKWFNTSLVPGEVQVEDPNQPCFMSWGYPLSQEKYMELKGNIYQSMANPPMFQLYGKKGGMDCITWANWMLSTVNIQGPYRPK